MSNIIGLRKLGSGLYMMNPKSFCLTFGVQYAIALWMIILPHPHHRQRKLGSGRRAGYVCVQRMG